MKNFIKKINLDEKNEKKQVRFFSEAFKREKVKMVEGGKITVSELSELYEVSHTAIYNWLKQYSNLPPTERVVIEKKSEGKKNLELLRRIKELERVIGQQQLEILYKEKVIELGSELLGEDIEKKYDIQQSKIL